MTDKEIQPFYKARAKEMIDMLFDKEYFAKDLSRDGMNDVEEFLAWNFQYQCNQEYWRFEHLLLKFP